MKTQKSVKDQYILAKEQYANLGVDTDKAIEKADEISISMHCWQGDDVAGFENPEGELTGGIQVTGAYPGKARNAEELRDDMAMAISMIPGNLRVNLHAIYAETGGTRVDRDSLEPKHFKG
ncbi:MAG: L-rhamnose isomerase, partial [Clostridiales bacterium]|nr:L-rhamnose isomerase [Clostridiales bacterium]